MSKTKYYKYLPKEFEESMLKKGGLKLSSIYDWRIGENKEITDAEEAMDYDVAKPLPVETFHSKEEIPFRHTFGLINIDADEIKIGENTFIFQNEYNNLYAYCLTTHPSKKVMREFGKRPDGTYQEMSCVEITDINKFAKAISNYLFKEGYLQENKYVHNNCVYATDAKRYDYDELTKSKKKDVYFLKEKIFAHQFEYRIIFKTKIIDSTLPTIYPSIPEITKYLRRHTIKN